MNEIPDEAPNPFDPASDPSDATAETPPVAASTEPTYDVPTTDGPTTDGSATGAASERPTTLHRSATRKIFGGVCGGIGERFDVDANIVRVVFVVLALVYGLGIALYLAMWVLIPRSPSTEPDEVLEPEHRRRWLGVALPLGVIVLAVIALATLHGAQAVSKGLALVWLIFLLVLAVVALGAPAARLTFRRLVALAFLGLVSFLILIVGVFALVVSLAGVPLTGGNGVRTYQPVTASQVQRTYRGAIGETNVDLSRVHFVGTRLVTVTEAVGQVVVKVPANAIVELRTKVGVGNVDNDSGTPVVASGHASPVLNLNLQVGIGLIWIQRYYPSQQ